MVSVRSPEICQLSQSGIFLLFIYCSFITIFFFNYSITLDIYLVQVLAKSAKVIPVMLMGKLVSNAKYKTYEYLSAVLISVGMIAFLTGSMKNNEGISDSHFNYLIDYDGN